MNLAQIMHEIATKYHEAVDEGFLASVSESIKNRAGNGGFSLEVDVSNINSVTLKKLIDTLRNNGFITDIFNGTAEIHW